MSQNIPALLINSLQLPLFESIDELSELTRLSSRLLYCLSMKTDRYYKTKLINKRSGGKREISIPSYTLHIVQRWILVEILNKILPTNRAMAFRKGKDFGHKQNAVYHADTLYGLTLDLKDFFPSITANKIYTIFSSLGYNHFAATILTNLCTLDGKLPQGSACSPALSNIVCITLDKRLIGLCEKRGIKYSRYADDMYFSCDDKAMLKKNFPIIKKIIEDEDFIINEKKTHFHTPSNKKQVTGITVCHTDIEDSIELKAPKKLKQRIREEIFICLISGQYENKEHILGEIAYVDYIEKENKHSYLKRIKSYINKQLGKIQQFPELVDAYNDNKFYRDLKSAQSIDISIDTQDEFERFESLFQERKCFLERKGLQDICRYSGWPDIIINPQTDASNNSADSDNVQ